MKTLLNIFTLILSLLYLSPSFAQQGSIKGVVRDVENNENIPFASISANNGKLNSLCDAEGHFSIEGVNTGYTILKVASLGYQSKASEALLIQANITTFVQIYLSPKSNVLGAIEVRPNNFLKREETPISMQSIGIKEIEHNPGSNRDISRVIQAFPGVGSTPAFRNDIIIRGGGPSENRFFLDDVEIPVLNHFSTQGASGGPVGIINADFVQNVDFYASAFPATTYNALSGVLDFKQKEGDSEKTNLQLAVGASEASITLDGPLSDKTTYIFSVRRSYLQLLFSAIGLPFLPTFNDYQLKTKTRFNKHNQLTIISIGALDNMRINTNISNPTPSQQAIAASIPVNKQWTYTIGGVYKHFTKQGYHSLVISRNTLHNKLYKYPENDESKMRILDYLSSETENKMRYEYHLRKGNAKYILSAQMEQASYSNASTQLLFISDNVVDLKYNSKLDIFKYGLSAQMVRTFFKNKLLTSWGMRLDANNYNRNTSNLLRQASPRLSLSYSINPSLKINAGVGRYFQQAAYTTLGYKNKEGILTNKDIADFIGLNQYNIGVEHFWENRVMFSLEGFYKRYFHYPIDVYTGSSLANQGSNYFVYGSTNAQFNGKGKSYGIELLNRINLKSLSVLASYTYFRSLFTDIKHRYIASAWDSQHIFSLTASKKLKKHWQIGAKWRYVGALPYTPYNLEKSAQKMIWAVNNGPLENYSQLNKERLPAFHQLDLRVDKQFFFPTWTLMLYFDVQNAYNFKSKGNDIIVRKKNADGSFQTSSNGQNYVLEAFENTQGTVLPTLGIMIKL